MKNIKLVIFIISILCLFWIIGLGLFIKKINNYKPANTQKAEAIVILTGGRKRIESGIDIYKRHGEIHKVFISGVNKEVDIDKLFNFHKLKVKNKNNIHIGYKAKNTVGNAVETIKWMKKENIKKIILVTSNYHMLRAKYELKRIDDEIKITEYPVYSPYVKTPYLKNIGSLYLISLEYTKYIITKINYRISEIKKGVFNDLH